MISRHTSSVHKDVVFPRLLHCDLMCTLTCRRRSLVLPGAPNVLSGSPMCSQTYHNHSHGTHVVVIRDLRYSECWLECPPRVWYRSAIDASKFTLHILSDTPGGYQWLKYILLMYFEALVGSVVVSGRIACAFRPDLHCSDALMVGNWL